jgi:hypothetical protein
LGTLFNQQCQLRLIRKEMGAIWPHRLVTRTILQSLKQLLVGFVQLYVLSNFRVVKLCFKFCLMKMNSLVWREHFAAPVFCRYNSLSPWIVQFWGMGTLANLGLPLDQCFFGGVFLSKWW